MDTARLSRIHQIAIPVVNLVRAIAFYRDTLGLTLLFEAPPGLAFFDCGGVRLMLSAEARGAASLIYYGVDDIAAAASLLELRGVTFNAPPHVVARLPSADVWLADFKDSEGNAVALMSEVAR